MSRAKTIAMPAALVRAAKHARRIVAAAAGRTKNRQVRRVAAAYSRVAKAHLRAHDIVVALAHAFDFGLPTLALRRKHFAALNDIEDRLQEAREAAEKVADTEGRP